MRKKKRVRAEIVIASLRTSTPITAREHGTLHARIRAKHGKANRCEFCFDKNAKRYEWALKKGRDYSDNRSDYLELCVSCHRKYDYTDEQKNKIRLSLYGDLHNSAKLKNEDVLEIIRLLERGVKSKDLAEKFSIDATTISNIKTGKSWGYLTGKRPLPTPPNKSV